MLEGRDAPLKMLSVEEAGVLLSKELEYCLRVNWGISSGDEDNELVIQEMMEVIWNHYKARIGINEIRLAFQLSTLKCFDFDLKLYYGRATAPLLVNLLHEYLKYRYHAIHAFDEVLGEQSKQLSPADIERWNKKSIIEGLQKMAAREDDLPLINIWSGYYERLLDSGLLVLTEEQKKPIWEQAKTLLIKELMNEIETERSPYRRKELQEKLSKLKNDDNCEGNKERRIIIGMKLAVRQWLEANREQILSGEIFSGVT